VFLAAIVTSAAMALYITQHKQLLVQDEVADMQSSVRASIAEVSTKVRMAGYKVPETVLPIIAYNTNPDTIVISYDSGYGDDVQIEHAMPQPSAELRCDGHDLSAFQDNDVLYIYDPFSNSGEFFLATQIQYSSSHIQHNQGPLGKAYPLGSKILKINRFKYYIGNLNTSHPQLMVQFAGNTPQVFADNITNLNIRYLLSSGAVVDVPGLIDMVREVIISVDARTDRVDNEFQTRYRTRSLSTRTKVRNLGVN
jgi:hypothetical protein